MAPTSTLSSESTSTAAQAISTHTHHAQSMPNVSFIWAAMTAPKKPKIASWMAR